MTSTLTQTTGAATLPTTMKGIRKATAGPGFEWAEVPVPTYGPNEVLIRVLATSMCGTDVHITRWDEWSASRIKPPMVYGHEFCGEVVALGANVTSVVLGDRVSAEMHLINPVETPTGTRYEDTRIIYGVDAQGCFAHYIALPALQLVKLPPNITPQVGACLDSLGNAVHTVTRGNVAGKTVLITGCGPIGLFAIPVAKALGATHVWASDISDYRLDKAREAGADRVIDARKESVVDVIHGDCVGMGRTSPMTLGVDVVLEMSGNIRAINDGLDALAYDGTLVMLGIPPGPIELDINKRVIFKNARLVGCNGREIFRTWEIMLDLLASGKVDINFIITHQMPLSQFGEAIELVASGQTGKVVMIPDAL